MKISAVIIAGNEQRKIGEAIASVAFADEVLVVDSESADETVSIARALGAKVISQPWLGFSRQKQFAADSAEHDWILSIDADERVSPSLRREIESLREAGSAKADAFRIPRLSFYLGRAIRHCGWYPDRQVRLFNRQHCRWNGREIHESVDVDGTVGTLEGDIHHYSVDDSSHHHRMIGERYAPLAALADFREGRKGGIFKTVFSPVATFLRNYILKGGIADGLPGFSICWFSAHHSFLKNLILWELSTGLRKPEDIHTS
jgi:glycosyltransferase involved in cell wall biosynthesis